MGKRFSKRKHPKYSREHPVQRIAGFGGGDADIPVYSAMSLPSVHTDAVVSLAAVKPGLCISGSKDKSVVLYDYENKQLAQHWVGHDREITKVCYGAASNSIFSASRDKMIKMWQIGKPNCLRTFSGHDMVVSAIHVNADNTRLCSGSRDNTVRIWDVETGACLLHNNIPQNLVTDVKWIPNSQLVLQTGEDKELRVYDARTMSIVQRFIKKQYIQMCCDVTNDGKWAVTCSNGFGGNGCEATLWSLSDGAICGEFKGHREAVEACVFLPSNQNTSLIATASRDCSIRVWDITTKKCLSEHYFEGSGPLTSLAAYEDGCILVGTFHLGVHVLSLKGRNTLSQVSSY